MVITDIRNIPQSDCRYQANQPIRLQISSRVDFMQTILAFLLIIKSYSSEVEPH